MQIRRILVIRFRRVGDAVLSSVLCSNLRKSFPHAVIDYVLNENIAPLFEGHPDIDNVVAFSDKDNGNILRFVRRTWTQVRANHYDVIIDTRSTVRTLLFSLFSLSTPYRIGTYKSYSKFFHNFRIDNRRELDSDVIAHLLMLLEPLNSEATIHNTPDFKLYVSDEERQYFHDYMAKQGVAFDRPVILAAVTSRLMHKAWNVEQMKLVLQHMIDTYQAQIVLNFSGPEEMHAKRLHEAMNNSRNIFTSIEARSLRQLSAMASNCDFFFGNEGGPRHISQAVGVPSYAIFPPGVSKTLWMPGLGEKCWGISPDDILPREEQAGLTYEQRFGLITAEQVCKDIDHLFGRFSSLSED